MAKRRKKADVPKKITVIGKRNFVRESADIVLTAIIISALAVFTGLAYTGLRAALGIDKKHAAETGAAPAEIPEATAVPTKVPTPAYVIPAKYRRLFGSFKTKEEIPRIQIEEAKVLYESGKALFVDARGTNEYNESHIKGAVSIPAGTPAEKISELKDIIKNKILISYCHGVGCHLADKTAFALYDAGYKKVIIFFGGWPEWTQASMPVQNYEPPEKYRPLFEEAASENDIREINLEEAKFMYDNNLANIIDADFEDKYRETHIDRAASIPVDKAAEMIPVYDALLKQKPVIVYCHGIGKKSKELAGDIYRAGHKKVLIFIEALPKWKEAGYPVFEAPKQ